MKKQFTIQLRPTYRSIISGLLAVLLLGVVTMKELHHLLDHHHEVAHCDSNGSERHLHSEEYAPVDCFICFFHFSPSEMGHVDFGLQPIQQRFFPHLFFYKNPTQDLSRRSICLRGPPVLIA